MLFGIISRTKQLQEIYYYGIRDHTFTNITLENDILSILDGTIKEVKIVNFNVAAYTGQTQDTGILINIRRDDSHNYNLEGVSTGFRDPFGVGSFNFNDTVAFTAPHEQTSDLMPFSPVINHVSFYKARMAMLLKKNEEFHIETRMSTMDGGSFSAGSSTLTWEIKFVVAPFVFFFDKAIATGLRFTWLMRLTDSTETASTEFPCSGFLTNMSVLASISQGTQDEPTHMIWSTQDVNMVTHMVTAGGTAAIRGSNHNAIAFTNHRSLNVNNVFFTWNYEHFGKSYIRITNRSTLNFIFLGEADAAATVWLTGDFIPFNGAHWKQIYVHIGTDLTTVDDWDDAIMFGVDLKNCQVSITANIAANDSAVMVVKLLSHSGDPDGATWSTAHGDVQDADPYSTSGLYSAQNLGAIIPFSGSVGSQSTVLNLGKVKAGMLLSWDLIAESLTVSSKIYFVITGQVDRTYFSKNNKYIYSPDTFDYANLEAMHNFQ